MRSLKAIVIEASSLSPFALGSLEIKNSKERENGYKYLMTEVSYTNVGGCTRDHFHGAQLSTSPVRKLDEPSAVEMRFGLVRDWMLNLEFLRGYICGRPRHDCRTLVAYDEVSRMRVVGTNALDAMLYCIESWVSTLDMLPLLLCRQRWQSVAARSGPERSRSLVARPARGRFTD